MRKNILILTSFLITFVLTCCFATYLYTYQQGKAVKSITAVSLIQKPWYITGDKTFSRKLVTLPPQTFVHRDTLLISYDLHGVCLLGDAASEIILVDSTGSLHGVSLAKYGKNCFTGEQTVNIPLSDFATDTTNITKLEVSFWYPALYTIDINKMIVYNAASGSDASSQLLSPIAVTPTASNAAIPAQTIPASASATPVATVTAVFKPTWAIQSVAAMKDTKDLVCNPRSKAFVEQWVQTAKELGVNYISISTPYDTPPCGKDATTYTKLWASTIHAAGLHVWFRQSFTSFEGIYSVKKDPNKNYLQAIATYIKANPDIFSPDDIFTPLPEPQNGGITGVTYCPQNVCIFSSAKSFNQWLRDAIDVSQAAFKTIDMDGKMKIGYYGFDGFVTWGNNNPQWNGILEPATVTKMGNITIDHYPEAVGDTMKEDLAKLQKKYPHTPIVIGEWGTITGGDTVTQVKNSMGAAAADKNIVGFNYWQMSAGGNESLINEDFSHKPTFAIVQNFFEK